MKHKLKNASVVLSMLVTSIVISLMCLTAMLSSFGAKAVEHETTISYGKINQDLYGTVEFDMPAIMLSYTAWGESLGLRLRAGKTWQAKNELHTRGFKFENQIDQLTTIAVMYRYNYQGFQLAGGLGYTDYKTTWEVNDSRPSWANDTDSGVSYHVELSYDVSDSFRVGIEYADLYSKNKEHYGKESTDMLLLNLSYVF